ncbi:MAG: UvrB/UvrC motif-containing protein [Acidimicrobiia bacterium]|nr:UvrB/UvrC motif-containing protein [Acidimicrobiia bacterium]
MAGLVVDALQAALPLRRCSVRLGSRFVAPADAVPCAPAQLGVAACPCAGQADRGQYADAVRAVAAAMTGRPDAVVERLTARMATLAAQQRYEEAALTRDRMSALQGAIDRTVLMDGLLARGRFEVSRGDVTWVVDHARLADVRVAGSTAGALPAAAPPAPAPGRPLPRALADEALVLARRLPPAT